MAAAARITGIKGPLCQYRQHGLNAIGGNSIVWLMSSLGKWARLWRHGGEEFNAWIDQVIELSSRLDGRKYQPIESQGVLQEYSRIPELSRLERLGLARKLALRRGKSLPRAVLYAQLMVPSP